MVNSYPAVCMLNNCQKRLDVATKQLERNTITYLDVSSKKVRLPTEQTKRAQSNA